MGRGRQKARPRSRHGREYFSPGTDLSALDARAHGRAHAQPGAGPGARVTDTYATARTGLDQIADVLLTDLGDLYAKAEPAERRMLNPALFTRIIVDEDEQVSYTPDEPVASVLAHTGTAVTSDIHAKTNLPRHQTGRFRSSQLTWR
ncbi:DUF3073 domain-containing protein [Micrococcus luteus]|uniref:DUF3073 domain-containing protein n=1 Tax=Micrococcus luteus TaxID=1270 RepID=UPI0021AB6B78|nr:DUF3073 domain-containing protein [Micrococcus luteus]